MRDYNVLENNSGIRDMIIAEDDGDYYIFKDNNAYAEGDILRTYSSYEAATAFLNGMYYAAMKPILG